MSKKPSFLHIEDCIRNIQLGKNVEQNLQTIGKLLGREFGDMNQTSRPVEFYVSIVDNNTGNLFGASVYPSEAVMNRMVAMLTEERPTSEILGEVWQKSLYWNIELDSIIIYDRNLKASPGEILAVILHELGHVAFSNSVPERLNRVFRTYTMIQSVKVKNVLKAHFITKKLLYFPILAACSTTNFKVGNMRKEVIADDFAYRCGYGEDLVGFIDKLLMNQGNSLINKSDKSMDDDVKVFMQWSVENLTELNFRKTKLKQSLKDDKIYLLENLHDELDRANLALTLIEQGRAEKVGQSKQTIEEYKVEVLKLIVKAKAIEIQKEKFGLFVKYPEGYEG